MDRETASGSNIILHPDHQARTRPTTAILKLSDQQHIRSNGDVLKATRETQRQGGVLREIEIEIYRRAAQGAYTSPPGATIAAPSYLGAHIGLLARIADWHARGCSEGEYECDGG